MPTPVTVLQVENLPHRKLSALKRKAERLGLTAGTYVRQLIEEDLELDRIVQNTPLDELAAPFRKALKGVSDDEIDRMVEAARTQKIHTAQTVILANDFNVILDTNTLVRGFGNRQSASGEVLRLCERRDVMLLLSRPVMAEYRRVLASDDVTRRHPEITPELVELVLRRLRYFAKYLGRVKAHFKFDRDPLDEKFIELAIAGSATHVVTNDKDLLSLTWDHSDAARRFRQRLPQTRVLLPVEFMREYDASAAQG